MPRREHKPTAKLSRQVEEMAAIGIEPHEIAQVLDITTDDLTLHYSEELKYGEIRATTKVAQNLLKIATGKTRQAVTAAQFWLKSRANWSDKQTLELQGDEDKPVAHAVSLDSKTIDAIRRRLIGDD